MKKPVKLGLFLGSYAPLFLLLALLEWNNKLLGTLSLPFVSLNWLPLVFIGLALLGILIIALVLNVTKSLQRATFLMKVSDGHNQETLAYLVTYLIPFVGFKFGDINGVVANAMLFVMIGFLYVQSNMIYINPVLGLMGYRVYKVRVDGRQKLMLAKSEIKDETRVKVLIISEGIYIEARN